MGRPCVGRGAVVGTQVVVGLCLEQERRAGARAAACWRDLLVPATMHEPETEITD